MMRAVNTALLLASLLMVSSMSAVGQDLYSVKTMPIRGFMPSADSLSSPVDHIDPASGKLHVDIPLASLPPGRGGSGFDLNLVYDSRLYYLGPTLLTPPPPYTDPESAYSLGPIDGGGWQYNVDNYGIDVEVRTDADFQVPCPPESTAPTRIYRVRAKLGDGSLHTMHLKGYEQFGSEQYQGDGFFGVSPTGWTTSCSATLGGWPYLNGWLTYYSSDGSNLRLEVLADGAQNFLNQPWYLYFPDGRRLAGQGSGVADALYDANGNGIHFLRNCYDPPPSGDCSLPYLAIVNDAGHEIRVDYNITDLPGGTYAFGRTDRITGQGPNQSITWTVNWGLLHLGQIPRMYTWSWAPWWPEYPLDLYLSVVKFVQLPLATAVDPAVQTPPVWNSYAFGYSDDSDVGWGEVDSMRVPTGALYEYRYSLENTPAHVEFIAHENMVRERKITHDGTNLIWTYDLGLVTSPDGSQTRYYYGNPPDNYRDPSDPSWWAENLVFRIEEPNGTVRKRVWARNRIPGLLSALSGEGRNLYIKRETVTIGNASGAPTLTRVTERTVDKNGNQLQNTEYDWVGYNPSGPEVGSSVKRVTQTVYYAEVPEASSTSDDPEAYWNPQFNGLPRRLDAVRRTEVRDGAGNIAALAEFEYDEPLGRGNLTAAKRWDSVKSPSPPGIGQLSSSNSEVRRREYDTNGWGNVTDIYDPPASTNGPEIRTHITYDSTGSFPERVDYAYQTPAQRSWVYHWKVEPGTSRPLPYLEWKRDDNNSITTSFFYDDVGRQTAVNEASLRQTITDYDDPNRMVKVLKDLVSFDTDPKLETRTHYDQLGRVTLVWTKEPNSNGINVKTTYYPALNRTVISSPYRTTADPTLEWTCTQTDASKRVTAVAIFKGSAEPTDCESTANRTGISTTVYDANITKLTDPAGKQRHEIQDSLGRLVQVIEDPTPGGLNYSTTYVYDALDNLTQVNQGVQSRTFQYSSLTRLLWVRNPETDIDAEGHSITYTYYDSGDLATRKDARGVVANFTYDEMRRIKTKTYTTDPAGTPGVTYNYHSAAPYAGQLQSVSSSVATTQYTAYDLLGRVTSSTHTIVGDPAVRGFTYAYWLNNSVKTVTNPSGRVIQYDVDDAGRASKIYAGAATYADMTVTSAPYTPDGRIAQMKFGNNLWETRAYQTPDLPTLFKIGTTQGANNKLELEYNFSGTANNGNLQSQVIRQYVGPTDTRVWTQNFSYDGVNRLLAASEPGGWSRSYGYDQYGNRWVSASSGPPPEVHEPGYETNFDANTNRLYVAGSTFDSAGNQTTFAPWTLSYDAENRNVTVDSATNGNGIFAYDGDGRRVKKTWTPYGGTPTTTYYVYNALGQLAAEYSTQSSTAGTSYVHKDMLGSTRMVTDAAGATVECYDYLPFGRMLSDAVNGRNTGCYPPNPDYQINSKLPQKFTGKERDAETRLDYFGARYYSSAQSRFTSPDPIGIIDQKSVDPQQWNMYAYTRNNPLRFLDPTGMYVTECKEADITKCDEDTQAFEAARQRNLKSKDKKIRQTAEAYGNYGEKGIMVTFLKQDVGGGGSVTFDLDNSGRATGTLTVNFTPEQMAETKKGPFGDTTLDAIIAHEGSHVIDDLKLISGGYRKKDNITHLKGEQNAYSVENKVLQTEIGRTNPDWQSKKAIEAFLKRNPGLYPNLNAPILDPNRIPDKAKK